MSWLKENWFKISILVITFVMGFSSFYYYMVFLPSKEDLRVRTDIPISTSTEVQVSNELEKLREEVELLKHQKAPQQILNDRKDFKSDGVLTNEEINIISKAVVHIGCYFRNGDQQFGSGTYLKIDTGIFVVTNFHVINNEIENDDCLIYFYSFYSKRNDFPYNSIVISTNYDNSVDLSFLRIKDRPIGDFDEHVKNYLEIEQCQPDLAIGTKVYIFGYPLSGRVVEMLKTTSGTIYQLIITEGIISGVIDTTVVYKDKYQNPPPNYFTSAKIDSGNSGGLAVSKVNGKVCLVGVPTWVSKGRFDNLGVIQSFRHINALSSF